MMGFFTRPAKERDINEDSIRSALADWEFGSRLNVLQVDTGWQLHIELSGNEERPDMLEQNLLARLKKFGLGEGFQILFSRHTNAPTLPKKEPSKKPSRIDVRGVKKIIAVASGKGGVGKSTIAAGLACALAAQGLNVGLLDADIYGPSLPKLMGLENQKPENTPDGIVPLKAHDVSVMSIGFMVDENRALIWRGPMVQSAFKQLLTDVDWGHDGELDVLILDTPPGTGDVQLTLAQSIDVAGAVIVSTPQELALADARKGVAMFQTLNVPIYGLIENMSGDVFGTGGAQAEATCLGIPFLGTIPLNGNICQAGDAGTPELSFLADIAKTIKERILS